MDHLRANKIHQLHHDTIRFTSSEIEEDVDNEVLHIERLAKLHRAIRSLPEQNQLIFKLSRFEGKTNQEIAEQLQLSKRTVETHISNALKKLKSIIFSIFILLIFIIL